LIASRLFELVQKNQFSIEQIIVALNSVIANQGDIPAFVKIKDYELSRINIEIAREKY